MEAERQKKMEALLSLPVLGRLATVSPRSEPHVVPVWFLWENGCIWIHTFRSTLKVRHLKQNPQCAFVVDLQESQLGLSAVLFEGRADLVTRPRSEVRRRAERIYLRYLGEEGIQAADPQSWLDSEEGLLIQITPQKVKTW